MDYYEADTEDGLEDQLETSDRLLDYQHSDQQQIRQQQQPVSTRDISNNNAMEYTYDNLDNENDGDSDYSLDYEYLGPRHPVYRDRDDADSIASELSDTINDNNTAQEQQQQQQHQQQPYFDMWDEDPYSTNDFTWESNDMRLTYFIKKKQRRLLHLDSLASWNNNKPSSFWRKEKGWPKQLPCSSTTTNHDQSANALCLVPTNYASSDKLYGIYRDRIIECGRPWTTSSPSTSSSSSSITTNTKDAYRVNKNKKNINTSNHHSKHTTTWIDSESTPTHTFPFHPKDSFQEIPTPSSSKPPQYSSPSSSSSEGSKFYSTHISVSLRRLSSSSSTSTILPTSTPTINDITFGKRGLAANVNQCISKFIPYTKYIKRSEFTPPSGYQNAYAGLGFEPLCLEHKYGYMAIGGLEGEFELYCCMNKDQPFKIWGTKFKGKDNIMLMTNAIQIVRWKRSTATTPTDRVDDEDDENNLQDEYDYFLFACMNEAGILVYKLPSHHQCLEKQHQHQRHDNSVNMASTPIPSSICNTATAQLYAHLRSFDHVPINDAKVSPDGKKLVCVGDDNFIFLINIYHHQHSSHLNNSSSYSSLSSSSSSMVVEDMDHMTVDDRVISFGEPVKLLIPTKLLQPEVVSTTTAILESEMEGHAHSIRDNNNNNNNNIDGHSSSNSNDNSYLHNNNDYYNNSNNSNNSNANTNTNTNNNNNNNDNNDNINNSSDLYNQVMVPYSSQHVVWNHSSEYFAHTSDTHYRVLVWRASTHDILYSIDTAGYTYGIKFHPYLDGVLAFANRYGYFHTVDLTQALDITTLTTNEKKKPATTTSSTDYCNIYDFDKQTTKVREHICNAYCINTSIEGEEEGEGRGMDHHYSAYHTQHLKARHEMTMVAFRGEKDRRLRILAKINGIQWSQDGRYLYVATKKRVLAYEFIPSQHHQHHRVSSLFGLAGQTIRQMLELQYEYLQQKKRKKSKKNNNQLDIRQKRQRLQQDDNDNNNGLVNTATNTTTTTATTATTATNKISSPPPSRPYLFNQKWYQKWKSLPLHIHSQVLKESDLATHW